MEASYGIAVIVAYLIIVILFCQLDRKLKVGMMSNPGFAANTGYGMNGPGFGMNSPGVGISNPGYVLNNSGTGMNSPGVGMNNPGVGMNNPMPVNNPGAETADTYYNNVGSETYNPKDNAGSESA